MNNQQVVQLCFETKIMGFIQNAFYVYFGTFWGKYFFEKLLVFFNIFRQWAKTFRFLSEIFQLGFRYCIPRVDWNGLRGNTFREKTRFFGSSAIWRKNIRLLSQLVTTGCQSCLQLVHRNTSKLKKLIENTYMLFLFGLCKKTRFCVKKFSQ